MYPDQDKTPFNYLPLPYRVSIERLDSSGERGAMAIPELCNWCDAYAVTYGLPLDDDHAMFKRAAIRIARRRFTIED